MLVRAFVPAHITAFFVPIIRDDPQLSGSLGAGVNLSRGTNVFISFEESLERHVHVALNGEPVKREDAKVTFHVIDKMLPQEYVGEVEVWQYFDYPTGHGFGNSGGGALGTALCLAYKFRRTLLSAAKVAHEAEVLNRGGLGDIVAQLAGGVEVRIKEGGPGVAIVDNLIVEGFKVLTISLGRLSTREVLDSDVVEKIKVEGQKSLENLLANPTLETLMREARRFAEVTGLMDDELKEIAREVDKVISLPSSMIMLGKGIFAMVRNEEVERVKELVKDLGVPYDIAEIYWGKPTVGRWFGES
ncbi:pantoate kinase [Pyrococcus abyssi]|uniref:Pantoate kinase n=1 Tax=Pyrococcus abyssi (strain GE5 / Orsay) TaxID=272844 RepID=Q9V1P4_PYRAB|nr:pantoate kinase [Pyrococcus abyssi]CAB49305.1 Predicted archaeal sugar kinase, DUF113 family [Pyrococcus abyssi GE5]CCE69760.1 TPA: hypothetical protein PAB2407 [Pyrococcus abyssi GE5]